MIKRVLDLAAGPRLAGAMERFSETPLPAPAMAAVIAAWVKAFNVDMGDSAQPIGAFKTLNAFFTRALKPGIRPIDTSPRAFVSPADGVLSFVGRLDAESRLPEGAEVKSQGWAAAELIGRDASHLRNGHVAVVYLSPRDYHRVHAPVSGTLASVTAIPGARYPVNRLGLEHVPSLFTRNLRTVFSFVETDLGPVEVVMVGATNVGRITSSVVPGASITRGDELGRFNLGSTVVLLWPDKPQVFANTNVPRAVRYGEALLTTEG